MIARNDSPEDVKQGRLEATASSPTVERLVRLEESYYRARRDKGPRSTYMAGESSRMNPVPRGIDPLGSDADYHYRTERNYFLMVERGRTAVRNHPLVEQGIRRLIANMRITGARLDLSSGIVEADVAAKRKWEEWCSDKSMCDWEQSRTFDELVAQSIFSEVTDGDILHVPLSTGQLQTWESHHIRTPFGHKPTGSDQNGIVHGVEIQGGRVVAYHVTPFLIGLGSSVTRKTKTARIPVYDELGDQVAFFAGFTHRFKQRRGISRLSPPRESMNGFDDLNYANIKSALRRSLISYIMESNQPSTGPNIPGGEKLPQSGSRRTETPGLGLEAITVEMSGEPAQVFKTPDSHTMKGWNANMPVQGFFEQAALLLTCLSVNLDLPLSFLLLDGSLVNFHGGRMTMDQVKMRMRDLQSHVISTRHKPIFLWKMRQWTDPDSPLFDPELAAYVEQGANFTKPVFRTLGWPYVKPLEDSAGEDLSERRNLRSLRSIHADHGDDYDDLMPQIITDRRAMVERSILEALGVAETFPDLDIDVLRLASELRYGSGDPTGVQLTLSAGDGPAPAEPARSNSE